MARAFTAFLSLLVCCTAFAQHRPYERLGPRTFESPSGTAKLWVNPSDPYGAGPAYCRVTVRGQRLWQRDIPFTLVAAGISDDGLVGGYAYTEGKRGDGDFVVAFIRPHGRLVVAERTRRKESRVMHADSEPTGKGLIFDPENNRLIVRIGDETWHLFRMSDCRLVGRIDPAQGKGQMGTWLADAKAVAGTPLILLNWYRFDDATEAMGQFFTLVDAAAKPVWILDLPGDFEVGKVDDRIEARDRILEQGTILRTSSPKQFSVRLIRKAARVNYHVTRVGGTWKVSETSREPFRPPLARSPKVAHLKVSSTNLRSLKSISILLSPAPKAVVRNVGSFDLFDGDQIAFIRLGDDRDLCVVDRNGRLAKRMPLPPAAQREGRQCFLAKASGSNFILVSSDSSNTDAAAWHVDVAAGTFTKISPFKAFWVQAVSAYPDGRFVVISTESAKYTSTEHLTLYAPDGHVLWDKGDSGYGGEPQEFLSPEDVEVDLAGQIVVLDVIRHTLQFFDAKGGYVKTIDLEKAWGREPSYPTEVTPLPNGGFWLYDFGAERPCYLLDAAGTILRNFAPTMTSGKRFDLAQAVRVDSAGNPWVTNGNLLMRLDDKGVAKQTLGAGGSSKAIKGIGQLQVLTDGRVLALDSDSNSVHAFSSSGKLLFHTVALPTDFKDENGTRMEVARSGDIYLWMTSRGNYLHYSAKGRRIGEVPWKRDGDGPAPPFKQDPSGIWAGELLLNQKGDAAAKLNRWPDRGWMTGPDAIAPDCSLMAFEQKDWLEANTRTHRMAFFKANGMPESQTTLPPGMPGIYDSAYDGRNVYFVTESGLVSLDKRGHPRWVFKPKGWNEGWRVYPSLGRIALFDGLATVTWYATE